MLCSPGALYLLVHLSVIDFLKSILTNPIITASLITQRYVLLDIKAHTTTFQNIQIMFWSPTIK